MVHDSKRSSDFIPFSDFVSYAPSEAGEQVKVNHDNCTAGTDRKQRLYIKRQYDGTILGYCHNCQKKGIYKTTSNNGKRVYRSKEILLRETRDYSEGLSSSLSLPKDVTAEIKEFPPQALVWLYRGGLTKEQIRAAGIRYSPSTRRVILPSYDLSGNLALYQARRVFDDDNGPKYYTSRGTKKGSGLALYRRITDRDGKTEEGAGREKEQDDSRILFLVEDVLSAIRISEFRDSLALLGVTLDFKSFNYVINNYDKFVIFLDDDNPTVKRQGIELVKRLRNHVNFSDVKIIHTEGRDPKEYDREELEQLLKEYD